MTASRGVDRAALLALVNLAAGVLLIKVGLRIMRDYDEQRRAGIETPGV